MSGKKTKTQLWIGIAVGMIAYLAVKSFLFKPPGIDKQNMLIASELNKTCPVMVDADTRLDNTMAQPENVFAYNYTLVNSVKDSIDVVKLEEVIKPFALQNYKTHPDMEFQRKNKTTLSYNYRDKNGEHILQFKVGPMDIK